MMDSTHGVTGLGVTFPTRALSPWPRDYQHTMASSTASFAFSDAANPSSTPTKASFLSRREWSGSRTTKYGQGKHEHVELMPQPSDQADDPLNWPAWKKHVNLASLLFLTILVGALKTALLTAPAPSTANHSAAALTAAPLLLSGPSGLLACALSHTHGRRPLYLLATVLLVVGSFWNAAAAAAADTGHYYSRMGARLLQGLGWGGFDTLVSMTIQDTYFEHERNFVVTVYNLASLLGTWFCPLVTGSLSDSRHPFLVIGGLLATSLPVLVLLCPETAFDRVRPSSSAATSSYPYVHPPPPPPPPPTRPLTPASNFTLSSPRPPTRPWRLRHRLPNRPATSALLSIFHHRSSTPFPTSLLRLLRALVAPTTILVFLTNAVPSSALFALPFLLSPLFPPRTVGALLACGPFLLSALATVIIPVILARRRRRRHGDDENRVLDSRTISSLAHGVAVFVGSFLALVGVLSFGLGICNFAYAETSTLLPSASASIVDPGRLLSPPLLSLQLGILAAAVATFDASAAGPRPALARSASFTCPSMDRALGCVADMHVGVVVLRSFMAGVLVLVVPFVVLGGDGEPTSILTTNLAVLVIVFAAIHVVFAAIVVILRSCRDEAVWRADGRVMGLVENGLGDGDDDGDEGFKTSASFFETD